MHYVDLVLSIVGSV